MKLPKSNGNYFHALTLLYHLMIHADNTVDPREVKMGKMMLETEGIDDAQFIKQLKELDEMESGLIYEQCLVCLRNCNAEQQLRCIAWMTMIANADGFMAKEEWQLIHGIYHTELNLKLASIMALQKEINATFWLDGRM